MCSGFMNFTKCTGMGLLLGMIVGLYLLYRTREETRGRKRARRALAAISNIMNDVQDIFKNR